MEIEIRLLQVSMAERLDQKSILENFCGERETIAMRALEDSVAPHTGT